MKKIRSFLQSIIENESLTIPLVLLASVWVIVALVAAFSNIAAFFKIMVLIVAIDVQIIAHANVNCWVSRRRQ